VTDRPETGILEPDAQAILLALPVDGSTIGNGRLRGQLSLDTERYSELTSDLKARGLVAAGRGRGGSLALTAKGQEVRATLDGGASGTDSQPDSPAELTPKPAAQSSRTELTQQELESRLWAAANSLHPLATPRWRYENIRLRRSKGGICSARRATRRGLDRTLGVWTPKSLPCS